MIGVLRAAAAIGALPLQGEPMPDAKPVKLQQCLESYTKVEQIEGVKCEKCRKEVLAEKQLEL